MRWHLDLALRGDCAAVVRNLSQELGKRASFSSKPAMSLAYGSIPSLNAGALDLTALQQDAGQQLVESLEMVCAGVKRAAALHQGQT